MEVEKYHDETVLKHDKAFLVYITSILCLFCVHTDVLDLAWSPDDMYLASGSVDNSVMIWNAQRFPGTVVFNFIQYMALKVRKLFQ